MHQSFKTVSSQFIISKISRTFKPSDSSWINDALEDVGWGIQAIGYHAGFVRKTTPYPYITVKHHRGLIPCDVERLLFVEQLRIDKASKNILNPDGTTPFPQEMSEEEMCNLKGIKMTQSSDMSLASVGEDSPRTTHMNTSNLENVYDINDVYVVTGFAEGLIKLHYYGWNIDKEGMPRVIDDFDYLSCLEFYCISQMILRGFKSSSLDYQTAFTQFETYRLRAENACKVMSLDRAERFEASWNRYARSISFSNNFYAGLEQTEYVDRS